jgi:hypothetical protein
VCRGVVLAAASATLAIAAHGIAGGGTADPVPTLLLAFGVSAIGIALAGRQYSLGAVLAVLGAAQLVTHLLLAADMTDMARMTASTPDGLAMIGAHAVAVLITSVLLVKADTALFALARALRGLVPVLVAPAPIVVARHSPRPTAEPLGRLVATSLCRGNARRGPPVAA